MTTPDQNHDNHNLTPWYKHTIPVVLFCTIAGIALIWGALQLPDVWTFTRESMSFKLVFTTDKGVLTLVTGLIGAIIGSAIGYAIWAKNNDFSQSRAVSLAGIWAGTLGATFFSADFVIWGVLILPAIGLLATYGVIGEHLHRPFAISGLATVFLVLILAVLLSGTALAWIPVWLSGGIFGLIFTQQVDYRNKREQRFQQTLHQQRKKQDALAQGDMPEENYTVGDDGELIAIDETQSSESKGAT